MSNVSNFPVKDRPNDTAVAKAAMALESQICDLERAAFLVNTFASHAVGATAESSERCWGHPDLLALPFESRETIIFGMGEVVGRARRLREAFYDALEGKDADEDLQVIEGGLS